MIKRPSCRFKEKEKRLSPPSSPPLTPTPHYAKDVRTVVPARRPYRYAVFASPHRLHVTCKAMKRRRGRVKCRFSFRLPPRSTAGTRVFLPSTTPTLFTADDQTQATDNTWRLSLSHNFLLKLFSSLNPHRLEDVITTH